MSLLGVGSLLLMSIECAPLSCSVPPVIVNVFGRVIVPVIGAIVLTDLATSNSSAALVGLLSKLPVFSVALTCGGVVMAIVTPPTPLCVVAVEPAVHPGLNGPILFISGEPSLSMSTVRLCVLVQVTVPGRVPVTGIVPVKVQVMEPDTV
jgi:hypothetical protein